MESSPRSIEYSVRLYKMLIKAYPASFHEKYSDEMNLVFRELATDAWRRQGAVGLTNSWFRVFGDLMGTVAREHLVEIQRRIEMKTAAYAILSFVMVAITYLFVLVLLTATIAPLVFGFGLERVWGFAVVLILYLAAFLTGLILTRVKPFFMPRATVPLGLMATLGLWGLGFFLESFQTGHSWGWIDILVPIGFGASVVLTSLVGCIVARKASSRLAKFSVPWFQLAGSLAVLVCTSCVVGVLEITLRWARLEPDMQLSFRFCLFALLVIGAITIGNLILLIVRGCRNSDIPVIGQS